MKLKNVLSKQRLVAIGLLALMVSCGLLLYQGLSAFSYQKIEPYEVFVELSGESSQAVFLSYDYGYGIQDQHIRRLELQQPSESFSLSISAWKTVHALYFIAPKDTPYKVNALSIAKNGVNYDVAIPKDGPTLEGDNWLYRLPLTDFRY